jgi:hypothetical protein
MPKTIRSNITDTGEKKILKAYQFPEDIYMEMEDIKSILEPEIGMKITNTNLMRILLKNWYDTNNAGS